MANTIIDFTNMGIAKEAENMLPIIYITEETPFVKRIQTMDDACYKLSKDFYREFYRK